MKNLICIVFLSIPVLLSAQVRSGINTKAPTTTLHVKATGTDDPLIVEGLKPGSGQFLVIDNNGVVKASTDKSNLAFVVPSVSNTIGVELKQTSQTGSSNYTENSGPSGSIPSGSGSGSTQAGSWIKITGMGSTFNILQASNAISISAEGMIQYDGTLSTSSAISYALGIFLDGKLIATRSFILGGDGAQGTAQKWSLLGQANNLSIGSHTVELYVTRRNTIGTGPNSVYVGQPAVTSSILNQFMAKAVMQINGVYN